MKKLSVLLPLFLIMMETSCNQKDKSQYYEYDSSISGATGYGYETVPGCAVGNAYLFSGRVDEGWGWGTMTGEARGEAPDTAYIYYYTYAEDKFYKGIHPLPKEKIEKLLNTKWPYKIQNEYDTFYTFFNFEVALSPCGFVNIWLGGDAGKVWLTSFYAQEANWDYEKVFPDRRTPRKEMLEWYRDNKMFDFVKEEVRKQQFNTSYWENLIKKYPWQISFDDERFKVQEFRAKFINEERYTHNLDSTFLGTYTEKAVPRELRFNIVHPLDPLRYQVYIHFANIQKEKMDPDQSAKYNTDQYEKYSISIMKRNIQLMTLFQKACGYKNREHVNLLLEFNDEMTSAKLFLQAGTFKEEIPGCEVKVYDSDRYNIDKL